MTAWSSLFHPFPPASLHCFVSAPGLHQIRLFDADVTQLMGELSNKYQPGVKSINPESKDCIFFFISILTNAEKILDLEFRMLKEEPEQETILNLFKSL